MNIRINHCRTKRDYLFIAKASEREKQYQSHEISISKQFFALNHNFVKLSLVFNIYVNEI